MKHDALGAVPAAHAPTGTPLALARCEITAAVSNPVGHPVSVSTVSFPENAMSENRQLYVVMCGVVDHGASVGASTAGAASTGIAVASGGVPLLLLLQPTASARIDPTRYR